jgi:Flp pilus assembly protein TadG
MTSHDEMTLPSMGVSVAQRTLQKEAGQALIMFALGLAVIMGFAALTIDVGLAYREKGNLQNAADSAALAGADELAATGSTSAAISQATSYLQKYGYQSPNQTISVHIPPTSGSHVGNSNYVEVLVSTRQSAMLRGPLDSSLWTISARAVASAAAAGQSFYALFAHGGSSSCSGNITMSGGGNTVVGAVQADGTLTTSGSSGSNRTSITGNTGYQCTLNTDNNTTITPTAVKTTFLDWPVNYTTSDFLPCTFGSLAGPDITLSDGTHWNAVTDPGYTNTLKPGVYCAQNNITGTLLNRDGTVTLVTSSSSGKIDISGGSTTLNAFLPNHVLAFSSSTSGNHAVVLSGGGSQWNGIVVAEFGGVSLTGGTNAGGTAAGLLGAVMAQNVTISGGASSLHAAYLPTSQNIHGGLVE